MIVARIAYRNLFLHKSKSLILGIIMCAGIAILFVGNSLIDTAVEGLRKMFVGGYTGDMMVTGPTIFPTTIFGETAGGEDVIPHISGFDKYGEYLKADARIAATLPMLSGQVAMGIGEQVIGQGSAFGVDIEKYRGFFSGNIALVKGDWPKAEEQSWIIISEASAAMLGRAAGKTLGPGDKIMLSALGEAAGTVIREVAIKGIVRFTQSSQQLARISLVDADTLRDLFGFAALRDGTVELTPEQQQFVNSFNPEELFSETPATRAAAAAEGPPAGGEAAGGAIGGAAAAGTGPAGAAVSSSPPAPVAAWQFILVKLKPQADAARTLKDLRKFAANLDAGDHAQDWVAGAGTVARVALTIRLVFNLMILVVAVIVIMITMNVLVVSISERTKEIGTLRALGARKRFVRRMILLETAFLAAIAGVAGLGIGYLILSALRWSGIRAPNIFLEALFAGRVLVPSISAGAAVKAFASVFGMSVLSSLYPIAVALRIRPVVAMQGE